MRPNPKMRDHPEESEIRALMLAFNRIYMRLLDAIQAGYDGAPDRLVGAVHVMYELKNRAQALMKVPVGDGAATVGPSFEYVPPDARD